MGKNRKTGKGGHAVRSVYRDPDTSLYDHQQAPQLGRCGGDPHNRSWPLYRKVAGRCLGALVFPVERTGPQWGDGGGVSCHCSSLYRRSVPDPQCHRGSSIGDLSIGRQQHDLHVCGADLFPFNSDDGALCVVHQEMEVWLGFGNSAPGSEHGDLPGLSCPGGSTVSVGAAFGPGRSRGPGGAQEPAEWPAGTSGDGGRRCMLPSLCQAFGL